MGTTVGIGIEVISMLTPKKSFLPRNGSMFSQSSMLLTCLVGLRAVSIPGSLKLAKIHWQPSAILKGTGQSSLIFITHSAAEKI